MLAIPGVGPVVAAGWLVATLAGAGVGAAAGAAAGGLAGSLTEAGVPEDEAHVYAEGVRRGSSLVTVRADEADAARIEMIMNRTAFVDPAQRRAEYETGGWSRFDESAPPYSSAGVAAEHATPGTGGFSSPDGTPGNPPGTATSRAFDRAAGTNVSGAYPSQSDGTPANPPDTAAERAVDRATGSNTSGANPGGSSRV